MKLQKIEAVCASGLFLALAILETITAAFGLLDASVPVFSILFAIGLWMVWAAARAGKMTERRSGASMVSGTAKALHIVNWVVIGILCFVAVILLVCVPFMGGLDLLNDPGVWDEVGAGEEFEMIKEAFDSVAINFGGSVAVTEMLGLFFGVLGAMLLLGAVGYALVNIFFFRNLHKFTKSLCVSFETGTPALVKVGMLRVWFLVLAILNSISFLGVFAEAEILPILEEGCGCAVLYVGFALLCQLLAIENSPEEPVDASLPEQI